MGVEGDVEEDGEVEKGAVGRFTITISCSIRNHSLFVAL